MEGRYLNGIIREIGVLRGVSELKTEILAIVTCITEWRYRVGEFKGREKGLTILFLFINLWNDKLLYKT